MEHKNQFKIVVIGLAAGLVSLLANNASAQTPVTGWGSESAAAGATITDTGNGNFTWAYSSGNSTARAALATPADFSQVGEVVELTGSVTITPQTFGNEQLRFGIFNNNGYGLGTLSGGAWSGATTAGWQGYLIEVGNPDGSGASTLQPRNSYISGDNWFNNGGSSTLTQSPYSFGGTSVANGTYAFTLTLDRLSATSVAVSYSFTETDGTGTFATSGSATDTGSENSDYSASATQIDAVGFFGNGNTGNMSFSNVEITQVPEPGTIALGVMGASALLFRRRK